MQAIKISATPRTQSGKNAARRLRASGQVPAVIYGKGEPARPLSVNPDEVASALYSERGRNVVVSLEVEGKSTQAMIAEYQYHPLSRELLHTDFVEVSDETPVEVKVPLRLTGRSKGVVMGGKLRQVFRELPVRCLPNQIPVELVHDITELDIEGHVAVADLALPEGVSVLQRAKQTVALVTLDRRAKKTDEEEQAEE
jgi:large subunit ribosomal protein L25